MSDRAFCLDIVEWGAIFWEDLWGRGGGAVGAHVKQISKSGPLQCGDPERTGLTLVNHVCLLHLLM